MKCKTTSMVADVEEVCWKMLIRQSSVISERVDTKSFLDWSSQLCQINVNKQGRHRHKVLHQQKER